MKKAVAKLDEFKAEADELFDVCSQGISALKQRYKLTEDQWCIIITKGISFLISDCKKLVSKHGSDDVLAMALIRDLSQDYLDKISEE